jgi:DNA-binding beta-propeller fold protein YncE
LTLAARSWAAFLLSANLAAGAARVAPGDFSLNLIAAGSTVVSSNSGWTENYLQAYDETKHRVVSRLVLPSLWYGLAYEPGSGVILAASGSSSVYAVSLEGGALRLLRTIIIPRCQVTAGLDVIDSSTGLVACNQNHEIVSFRIDDGRVLARAPTREYPYAVRALGHRRVAVTMLGPGSVTVYNAGNLEEGANGSVGRYPADLLVLAGGAHLAVACSDSDSISIIDLQSLRETRRYDLTIPGRKLAGLQPIALAYDSESHRLWVALAAVNALAAFDGSAGTFRFRGMTSVGAMPSGLALSPVTGTLFIASARDPVPGPNSLGRPDRFEFIGTHLKGGIEALSRTERDRSAAASLTVARHIYGSGPSKPDASARRLVRQFTGTSGPIRHVFYVIKENRTYDQVLGDMKEGDGASELTLFGERVTPNHHQLARDFLLFDRFFVDSYVSADGHMWSTAATSTSYVDRFWPLVYSHRADGPFEAPYDGDDDHDHPVAAPGSGFLWDRALAARLSFRNYGEWNVSDETNPGADRNYLRGLKDHFDPRYLDAVGEVRDQSRINEFEREFREFEKNGNLPRLVLIHLPNDHTMGAKPGYPTPAAMVADNDLALGRLVDIISHSRYWPQSAIFVLEDDAQDGPDHVDARRSVLLVVSPYTRRGSLVHRQYSTVSVLKTMEQLLGLPSMTYFDDRSPSLLAEFDSRPNTEPYEHRPAQVDLNQKTPAGAPGSKESAGWDFSHPDRVPDEALNRVIWQAVKGGGTEPPALRSLVVLPPPAR